MAKCPKCKKKITFLCNWRSGEVMDKIKIVGGKPHYEDLLDFEENGRTNDFECPYCDEVLATNEEDAIKILKLKRKPVV